MDLILNGGVKMPIEETPIKPRSDWICSACTYVNSKDAISCAICDALVPVIEELTVVEPKKQDIPI